MDIYNSKILFPKGRRDEINIDDDVSGPHN